jgi:hypothetical protein
MIARSPSIRAAVWPGQSELVLSPVPLASLMRSLLDIDTRERHNALRTVTVRLALLQLIHCADDHETNVGNRDKESVDAVMNVHRSRALLNRRMGEVGVGHRETKLDAKAPSPSNASMRSSRRTRTANYRQSVDALVAGARSNAVPCQALGVESARPARVSAHDCGAVIGPVDAINWHSVWTIGYGRASRSESHSRDLRG